MYCVWFLLQPMYQCFFCCQVQQDITANDTKHLGHELEQVQSKMKGLYADHGHFYTALDELGVSFNTSRIRTTQIERDTNLLRLVLQQLLQAMVHNTTGNNVSADIINDILKNTSIGMKGRPPGPHSPAPDQTGHDPCQGSRCRQSSYGIVSGLQRQLDEASVDVEQLKDEMSNFYNFLQSVQDDVRHVRGQQEEDAMLAMDMRRYKTELDRLRRNISNIEHILHRSNGNKMLDTKTEIVNGHPDLGASSAPRPHRVNPNVNSSAQKAGGLSYTSHGHLDDVMTLEGDETDEYDVIVDTPPTTWTHTSEDEIVSDTDDIPQDTLHHAHETNAENNKYAKNKSKAKSSKNDVIQRINMSNTTIETYSERGLRPTVTPSPDMAGTMETLTMTTTSPYVHNVGLNYKNSLKVKPSESDGNYDYYLNIKAIKVRIIVCNHDITLRYDGL